VVHLGGRRAPGLPDARLLQRVRLEHRGTAIVLLGACHRLSQRCSNRILDLSDEHARVPLREYALHLHPMQQRRLPRSAVHLLQRSAHRHTGLELRRRARAAVGLPIRDPEPRGALQRTREHAFLASGRTLEISAGHPTADGRTLGDLRAGGTLDGQRIESVVVVPYRYPETYDILPASDSGTYFAAGVLIGSTLAR
jgi:hypothetical protein